MSAPDLINTHPILLLAAAFVVFGIGQYWWRYNRARRTAEDWLREHHYRVVRLRLPWFTGMVFGPSLLRDPDRAFVFEAVIDDTELGGTGTLWLRVWTTWLGTIDNDVEIAWKQMPDGGTGEFKPLAERLVDEQLALMRRIAAGKSRFYAPRRLESDGAEYDEMVEHLLALSRRGMIICSQPAPGIKGRTQYSDVSDVALTAQGQTFLASRPES